MKAELAGDGWRYRASCLGGCGRAAIVVLEHLRDPWCSACLRRHHQVDEAIAAMNAAGGSPRGVSWPRETRPEAAVSLRKSKVVSAAEVGRDDERLPPRARALAERVGGRVLLSIARRSDSATTAVGKASANWSKLDTLISVQWRPSGRPPTIMAFWRNGLPYGVMIGQRTMTHTDAGIL